MAAVVLTLAISFLCGGLFWLACGPLLALDADKERNALLNLLVYIAAVLPFAFLLVFFALETL